MRTRFWVLVLWILACAPRGLPQDVKVIHIPDDIKVEENVVKETVVSNLSDQEIYKTSSISIIDDFIYIGNDKPVEVIKLSLQGKIVGRGGSRGRGPGELVWIGGIREFKGNIGVVDPRSLKLAVFNKKLEFIEEFKILKFFMDFLVDKSNRLVFLSTSSNSDYYFDVYSEKCRYLWKFARKVTSPARRRKEKLFDDVRHFLYIPEEDGIWASFKNRYDLRYYKKKKLAVEIKAKKNFFKGEEQIMQGVKVVLYRDRSIHLARVKNHLFYFYWKGDGTYCDIYDLTNYRLIRRIKFKRRYRTVACYKDNIFYAMAYDDDYDVLLLRLEL